MSGFEFELIWMVFDLQFELMRLNNFTLFVENSDEECHLGDKQAQPYLIECEDEI